MKKRKPKKGRKPMPKPTRVISSKFIRFIEKFYERLKKEGLDD